MSEKVDTLDGRAAEAGEQGAAPAQPARRGVLAANRNFRLMWLGETVSQLGDQFYFVALPWLVFQITGSALAFGTILMVAGIPRAAFSLFGGVVTDRVSARTVMIASNVLRLGLTAILVGLVAAQLTQMWMLVIVALAFGTVDAFFYPAFMALIPVLAREDELQETNALVQGSRQITQIAGPALAGALVHTAGLVWSFAFDAATFLFTSVTLSMMRGVPTTGPKPTGAETPAAPPTGKRGNMLADIGEMLRYVGSDRPLTALFVVVAAINLFFTGPLIVGTAALSKVRFSEGSLAFGALFAAFGVGSLIGMLASRKVKLGQPGVAILLMMAVSGGLMVALGFAQTLVMSCALAGLMGLEIGFSNIIIYTWMHKRVRPDMMGRVMSLLMLAGFGLEPISNALSGAVADWNLTALFVGSGVLVALTCLGALTSKETREIAV